MSRYEIDTIHSRYRAFEYRYDRLQRFVSQTSLETEMAFVRQIKVLNYFGNHIYQGWLLKINLSLENNNIGLSLPAVGDLEGQNRRTSS